MDPLIKSLVRFQDLNLEISRLDARFSQIPADIKAIDAEQQAASASIARAREHAAQAQKRRRDHERELQDLELKISKYNDQGRDVKTNEQYRAILHEIENVKTQIGQVEEKILLAMEDSDTFERQVREEEKVSSARKGEFEARRSVLDAERDRIAAERRRLAADRDEVGSRIPSDAMEVYDRVVKTRGVAAMARARDERCSGCNVRLRPQVFADVRKNNQVLQCESCRRILYYVEETPRDGEAPDGSPAAEAEPA